MKSPTEQMLSEFLASTKLRNKAEVKDVDLDAVSLRTETNIPVIDGIRVLVKEFAKNKGEVARITKSLNAEILRLSRLEGE